VNFRSVLRQVCRVAGGALAALAFGGLKVLRGGGSGGPGRSRRDGAGRKWAEEALRESKKRFRLLAEKMSDLVCLHEPDGCYIYISPSCRRLLGYEPEELLGTDPYDLFPPDDLERIRTEAHDKALEGQGAVSIIYRIRKKSGEYAWFETLTEPILAEGREVVRLQTSSRDVSERKRVERVLAEAARQGRRVPGRGLPRAQDAPHRDPGQRGDRAGDGRSAPGARARPDRWPRNTTARPSTPRSQRTCSSGSSPRASNRRSSPWWTTRSSTAQKARG
jgi:PAS domain S-box-containing protein